MSDAILPGASTDSAAGHPDHDRPVPAPSAPVVPSATGPTAEQWRSRIVGHGRVKVADLVANPKNWRIHPENQQALLKTTIGEIGFIKSITVNIATGFVVDGHLRAMLALRNQQEELDAEFIELTEEEEEIALFTLDPIAALAVPDREQYTDLGHAIATNNSALADYIQSVLQQQEPPAGDGEAPESFQSFDEGIETEYRCPSCGYSWSGKPR